MISGCAKENRTERTTTEHIHVYSQKTTEATCTQKGQVTNICEGCGDEYIEEIPVVEHSYVENKRIESDCVKDGSVEYRCTVCENTYADIIKAKGHTWKNATCTEPKTCKVCKTIEGEALGHQYDGATCIKCNYTDQALVIDELKSKVKIDGVRIEMNSVGGVDVYITWKNMSDKEIKYMRFAVKLYNRVGDVISCDIRNSTKSYLRQTGPIPKGKGMYNCWSVSSSRGCTAYFIGEVSYDDYKIDEQNGWEGIHWENVWYNTTARYAKVVGVDIEYMDGTKFKLEDDAIFNELGIETPDIDAGIY